MHNTGNLHCIYKNNSRVTQSLFFFIPFCDPTIFSPNQIRPEKNRRKIEGFATVPKIRKLKTQTPFRSFKIFNYRKQLEVRPRLLPKPFDLFPMHAMTCPLNPVLRHATVKEGTRSTMLLLRKSQSSRALQTNTCKQTYQLEMLITLTIT